MDDKIPLTGRKDNEVGYMHLLKKYLLVNFITMCSVKTSFKVSKASYF